jgi:hypothetical protein
MDGNYFLSEWFLAKWGWIAQYVHDNTNSAGNQGAVKDALNGKTSWYNYRRAAAEFVLFFAEQSGVDFRAANGLEGHSAAYILGEGSTSFADPAIAAGWEPVLYEDYMLEISDVVIYSPWNHLQTP